MFLPKPSDSFPSMMNSFQTFAMMDLNWTPCIGIKGFRMESEKFLIISVFLFWPLILHKNEIWTMIEDTRGIEETLFYFYKRTKTFYHFYTVNKNTATRELENPEK